MQVWFPRSSKTYALIGKFPHGLIDPLLIERKIEACDLSVGPHVTGYKVLQCFTLEAKGLVLWVNDDCIITGE